MRSIALVSAGFVTGVFVGVDWLLARQRRQRLESQRRLREWYRDHAKDVESMIGVA